MVILLKPTTSQSNVGQSVFIYNNKRRANSPVLLLATRQSNVTTNSYVAVKADHFLADYTVYFTTISFSITLTVYKSLRTVI